MIPSNRFVTIVVSVGLVVAIVLLISHGLAVSADVKQAPESAGRYQFFKNQRIGQPNEECLLDTATGKVWRLRIEGDQQPKWVLAVEGPR